MKNKDKVEALFAELLENLEEDCGKGTFDVGQ